jgi:hypothetical protein
MKDGYKRCLFFAVPLQNKEIAYPCLKKRCSTRVRRKNS